MSVEVFGKGISLSLRNVTGQAMKLYCLFPLLHSFPDLIDGSEKASYFSLRYVQGPTTTSL